jgi:hypothetical protein
LAGLFPSIVNVNSGGVIQTAVLSSSKFDATKIDPATILFGDTGTEAPPANWSLLDVDGDGQLDLQLVFNVQQTGIACDTTLMSLTGKLLTGTQVRGTTAIKTSGC